MSSELRRRDVMGGALAAAGAAHLLTGAALGAGRGRPARACDPAGPGVATSGIAVAPGGRTVWAANTLRTTITAHGRSMKRGRSIDVGGAPREIAIADGGHVAVVTTAFYDRPGVAVVDLARGKAQHTEAGAEPCAVALTPDGRTAFVTDGAAEGGLIALDVRRTAVTASAAIGRHPRGIAIHPDGDLALVALNGGASLLLVDLDGLREVDRIKTLPFPRDLAIAPDGRSALVTHNAYGADQVSVVDLKKRQVVKRVRVGRAPAGVAFGRSGSRALVALSGSGRAAVLDGKSGRRLRSVRIGGTPGSVAAGGRAAFVADRASGKLTRISLGGSA